MHHIIIGSGVAGTSAAQAIRAIDPACEITVITDEPYPFYSRIRLIDFLAGSLQPEQLFLKKPEWYAQQKITLCVSTRIASIDAAARTAVTEGGARMAYDKLLLATGGVSFIPPIPGASRGGVFALRTMDEARRIVEHAKSHKRAVIIGGGLLGLEAGNNLIKAGCGVSVVEFFPRLLPRQMDPAGAAVLTRQLEGMGFSFHLGAKTKELAGGASVEAVTLEDGTSIPADLVLISAGVRPNAALAQGLGLTINKGIAVNDRMETGLPDIWAAGDPIEHRGVFYGIWPAAEEQGKIAGTNMAGGNAEYHGTVMSNTLKVAGVNLAAAGDIDADGKLGSITAETASSYKKLVLKDNRIVGAILYGDTAARQKVFAAISAGKDVSAILNDLRNWNFDRL